MEQPLAGRRILVTRARAQASEFSKLLQELGARVVEIPTIRIVPLKSPELVDAINSVAKYDWVIFTSANGVRYFFEQVSDLNAGVVEMPRIAVVGPSTASALEEEGLTADLIPDQYLAENLLHSLLERYDGRISGLRILIPAARDVRPVIKEGLQEKGARVDCIPVYETILPEENRLHLRQALEGPLDLITFTSSSTVRNFVEMVEKDEQLREFPCGVIGPITATTARENQLHIVLQPEDSTIPSFVEAITQYFSGRP